MSDTLDTLRGILSPSNSSTEDEQPARETPSGDERPQTCPPCFNCAADGCLHQGACAPNSNRCICPMGFTGQRCEKKACGSPLQEQSQRVAVDLDATCEGKCEPGFGGILCNLCQNDAACPGEDLFCKKTAVAYELQHLACSVTDSQLQAVFPGEHEITASKDRRSGTATVAHWYNGKLQFTCKASECAQVVRGQQVDWKCVKSSCECNDASAICGGDQDGAGSLASALISLRDPINAVAGDLTLRCDEDSDVCSLGVESLTSFLPEGMDLQGCSYGECTVPSSRPEREFIESPGAISEGAIWAIALTSALSMILIATLLYACLQRSRLLKLQVKKPAGVAKVTFENLSYNIGNTQILRNISGSANPGRLLAIMGPSGAGKSSLLEILHRKSKSGEISGTLSLYTKDSTDKDFHLTPLARMADMTGYVDQEDVLLSDLTVQETLRSTACLRLGEDITQRERNTIVDAVIQQLGLWSARNQRIGGGFSVRKTESQESSVESSPPITSKPFRRRHTRPGNSEGLTETYSRYRQAQDWSKDAFSKLKNHRKGLRASGQRGLSGGQKRRISIGVALVSDPALLILDEPTSGLDSHNAFVVLQTLHKLAKHHGKTVVCSIHQPRSDMYELFDDVLVLAKGEPIYFGPANKAFTHFQKAGFVCPGHYSIADHLIDLAILHQEGEVDLGIRPPENQLDTRVGFGSRWPMAASASAMGITRSKGELEASRTMRTAISAPGHDQDPTAPVPLHTMNGTSMGSFAASADTIVVAQDSSPDQSKGPSPVYRTAFLTQFQALATRSLKLLSRNAALFWGHFFVAIVLGIFIGGAYFASDLTLAGLQNRFGALFFILALLAFSSLSTLGNEKTEQVRLFLRERDARAYHPLLWGINALAFDLLPLRIVPTLVMSTIAYFMIGLTLSASALFSYLLVLVLFSVSYATYVMFLGVLFHELQSVANLMASITTLLFMLFGGFLINQASVHPAIRWIQYLSPFRYAFEALLVNEASDIRIRDDLSGFDVQVPALTVVESLLGFDPKSYWRDTILLLVMFVMLVAAFLVAVIFRLKDRR